MRLILGVDPGFQGSLAVYDPLNHLIVSCIDMPLLPKKKPEDRLNIDSEALSNWISGYAKHIDFANVENVCGHPGQSISAMFRFGYGAGMLHGILSAHRVKIQFLQPAVWKAVLNLSHDKSKSITLAKKLFPLDARLFSRKKDDGRAEAVLLAYLGGVMQKSGAME